MALYGASFTLSLSNIQKKAKRLLKKGSKFAWRIFRKGSYRHRVEEQAHEGHQQSNDQELDQTHLVVIPQHVLEGLEWVHEPREG